MGTDRIPARPGRENRNRPVRAALGVLLALLLALGALGKQAALAAGDVHWGYSGEEGPEHWGDLSPDFAPCAQGKEQTPVDIPATAPINTTGIVFNYAPGALTILNNGHTVQANYPPGSAIQVDGTTYRLVQFHFHARSEHTLAGQYADLELHLVHQSATGNLAVVGVLIHAGAENSAYAPVMTHLPAKESPATTIPGVTVDAANLLPADRSYYRYNGSLTTPPCTESVKWFVMRTPVELSAAQIAAFTAIYADDYRPLQPLNNRTFLTASPVGMPRSGRGTDAPALLLVAALLAALLALSSGLLLARRRS